MTEERTVIASNEELRQLLVLVHSTLAYGSSAVATTLAVAWGFAALSEDLRVPTMLPILAIAAVVFALCAWVTQEEVQKIGKPYRAKVS